MTHEVELIFLPEQKNKGCIIGEHYYAICPFCEETNLIWSSELEKVEDGTNKCPHFSGLNKSKVVFRDDFDVVVDDKYIYVNNILFEHYDGLNKLIGSLEYFLSQDGNDYYQYYLEDKLTQLYAASYSSNGSGGPNDRARFLLDYLKKKEYKEQYTVNYQI